MGVGGVTNIRFACLFPVLLRTGHCIGMLNTASDFASYSFGFEGLAGDLSETLEMSSLFLCPLTRLGSCGLTAWLIESWQCLTTENLILGLAFVVAFQFSFIRKLVSKEGASVFMNTFLCIFFWAIINQIWQNWSWKFTVLSYRESPGHHCGRETWAPGTIPWCHLPSPPLCSLCVLTLLVWQFPQALWSFTFYFSSSSNTERPFSSCIHRTLQTGVSTDWMKTRARCYQLFGLKVN